MEVTLRTNVYPVRLRNVIQDSELMQKHGQQIVMLLLQALLDLEEQELVVRNICPSTTYLAEDYSKLMFADSRRICIESHSATAETDTRPPYSSSNMAQFIGFSHSSPEFDHWSTGIMILEIIVGTELVLANSTYQTTFEMIELCEEYLDKSIVCLLHLLLGKGASQTIKHFIEGALKS